MKKVCSREFDCKGQCLLNLVAGYDTWNKYSKKCSGSTEEQKFWNGLISDGVKPSEQKINEFYKLNEIKVDGIVDLSDNKISEDEFWDRFIDWIESNNWSFGGSIEKK